MSFKSAVLNTSVEARTTNGMKALASSLSLNADLFFKIGASRGKDVTTLFEAAYQEDSDLALRIAQWVRDVRGGAGERKLYRDILLHIEKYHPDVLVHTRLLDNAAEIGRWDDLLIFQTDIVKARVYEIVRGALEAGNGLAAKWMPRKGPIAIELRTALGLSPKRYRKTLVNLTNVVETQMCQKDWANINFSHVPSLAMSRYMKAFGRNAREQFTTYKEALKTGVDKDGKVVKINAGAVFPHDVIKSMRNGDVAAADAMWEALPNYIGDASMLPLVDVSGSMTACIDGTYGRDSLTAMDVAVSLGLYCSGKNKGAFKDLFLTFTGNPKFVHVKGSLSMRYKQMSTAEWGGSTNLHGAFEAILKTAMEHNVPAEDMPEFLLILSDMQFNSCVRHDDSAIQMIRRKYESVGYKAPGVVFWNISSHDNVPVKFNEHGTALVSGFSPSIAKAVLAADPNEMSPENVMRSTVMSDRYNYN